MKMVECILRCKCGGTAKTIPPDQDGLYFLADNNKIYFRALCDNCGDIVVCGESLMRLIVQCPNAEGERGN